MARAGALANRLGIIRVRAMQVAETRALLQLTHACRARSPKSSGSQPTTLAWHAGGWEASTTGQGVIARST